MADRIVTPAISYPSSVEPLGGFPEDISAGEAGPSGYVFHTGASGVIDPSMSYWAHSKYRVEALGANTPFDTIPDGGLTLPGVPIEGTDQRFGFVSDPDDPTRKAVVVRLGSTDPLTASATRLELSCLGTACVEDVDYTIGFAYRTGAWKQSDDEQAVFQMKSVIQSPGNPYLALVVGGRPNGANWVIRYNADVNPQQAGNSVVSVPTPWEENTWEYCVIHLRRHWDPAFNPFVKIWRNGSLVVDYSGPISFNLPGDVSQTKIGIYHWTPPAWVAPLYRVAHFKGLLQYAGLVPEIKVRSILSSI